MLSGGGSLSEVHTLLEVFTVTHSMFSTQAFVELLQVVSSSIIRYGQNRSVKYVPMVRRCELFTNTVILFEFALNNFYGSHIT